MKAAIVERPGHLVVRDLPDPVPGDYDALCRLEYGATCTGTDSHLIGGTFPFPVSYPAILGHESVGRVVAVGRKVRNLRAGDLVTRVGAPPTAGVDVCWGGFASMGIAKDHWAMAADGRPEPEWTGFRVNQLVPPSVDPRTAPMLTTWRETLSYLVRMGVGPRSRVLVIGSGGNGLSFARHAKLLGAGSWMAGSARLERTAIGLGLDGFRDYRSGSTVEELRSAVPEGFTHIVEAVGRRGEADRFLPLLEPGGRIGVYGLDDFAAVAISPRLAAGSFTVWNGGYDEAETHQRVCELVLRGKLDASAWYDAGHPYPLSGIAQAFEDLRERKAVKALVALSP
jgi:threonine dehydrogenase-like Zn-dependent dehydrogenase